MGAFYGSIHLRTGDVISIRTALEKVFANSECKFLVGPPLEGWVSIFPEGSGQDASISAEIAKVFPEDVLHLMVHDDDIFAYYFYRKGRCVDQYSSCPDYFGEVSDEEKRHFQGQPELLKDLLPKPENLAELRPLLGMKRGDSFTFEQDRMGRFVKLIGLPNALSSYEYLQQGERQGIKGWKQFIQVPDLRSKTMALKARLRAEKKGLTKQGILLAELFPPFSKKEALRCFPQWCQDRTQNGFLICWDRFNVESPILSVKSTWTSEPIPSGLKLGSVHSLKMSPSGKYLAVGHASGDWKMRVWDWSRKKILLEVDHSQAVSWVEFTSDEKFVISQSNEVIITSLETRQPVKSIPISGGIWKAALHPSGSAMVAANQDRLYTIDLSSQKLTKILWVGGKVDFDGLLLKFPGSTKWAESWGKRGGRGKESVMSLHFSKDGSLLFCGTNGGLRVYGWEDLFVAKDETPPPRFSVSSELAKQEAQEGITTNSHIYGLALDAAHNRLLFCGLEGKIQFLDLSNGESGILLDPPGKSPMTSLGLSTDNVAVCCSCMPNFKERDIELSRFQIWNYSVLCKLAGLE
ncbi:MAG: hypothetical protein HY360_21000 [Verrucomicrobia bacterium]|nr:hypothetical protein [Verrucomicrobiota bacterium]